MPNTYTDVPISSHTLAADQPPMEANFNYLANTLGTSLKASGDHQISTGGVDTNSFEGRHNQTSYKSLASFTNPIAALSDGATCVNFGQGGELLFLNANTNPNAIAMTATAAIIAGGATSGTPVALANGYTFLPGSLLLQWGISSNGNNTITSGSFGSGLATGTVTFATGSANINFPNNIFWILPVAFYGAGGVPNGAGTVNIDTTSLAARTQFKWALSSGSSKYTGFYWVALGN